MTFADWSSMELFAAAPRWHLAAVLAVGGAVLYVIGIAGLKIAHVRSDRQRRDPGLRRCPLCDADAVCAIESEAVDALQVSVRQQCGQCHAWRRNVTTPWILSRHERRLDDDRRMISRQMEQFDPAAPAARRTHR
jgi:hypothetical protein